MGRTVSGLKPFTITGPSITFWSAVLCGKRLNCWKTIPACVRRRRISSRLPRVLWPPSSRIPATSITPSVGSSRKLMHRRSVDLPDPDLAEDHHDLAGSTSMLMPFSTSFVPKYLWRFSTRTTASPFASSRRWLRWHPAVLRPGSRRSPAPDRSPGRVGEWGSAASRAPLVAPAHPALQLPLEEREDRREPPVHPAAMSSASSRSCDVPLARVAPGGRAPRRPTLAPQEADKRVSFIIAMNSLPVGG
jgi:hypothetical protein